jgi:Tfp pilus assembly protein PilX
MTKGWFSMQKARFRKFLIPKLLKQQDGYLLVAALTLMSGLTLLGTTAYLLSSTDIKISSNFKNNQMALQVAIAGAERAREALRVRNSTSSDSKLFSDELAYYAGSNNLLTGSGDDLKVASSVLNGVSYNAYVTNDSVDGSTNKTDSNGKAVITSTATGADGSKAVVSVVVSLYAAALDSPATIYSKGDVTGNGSSLTVDGNDQCATPSTALAPIFTKDPATTSLNGSPTLTGSPSTPQHGTLDIDIASIIEQLKIGADYTLTEDTNNTTYGDASHYKTVYSWPDDPEHPNENGIKLNNLTGYGILLIKGDLVLGGGFEWNGIIITTGSVTLNGGGAGINIRGQVFSGTSTLTDVTINGGNSIKYDSCNVSNALNTKALRVVSWQQSY